MAEVPRQRTPAKADDVRAALDAEAGDLSSNTRALMMAQLHLESAGFNSLYGHNPGNLSASDKGAADFYRPIWFAPPAEDASERIKRLHQLMLEGKAPRAFRSFPSLRDGVAAYVKLLRRDRYRPLLTAKTPAQYARRVKSTGYAPDIQLPEGEITFARQGARYGWEAPRDNTAFLAGLALLGLVAYTVKRRR